MPLGHLMTRSGLTLPEVSLTVSPGFFCLLVCSVLLSSVIRYGTFCLHDAKNFFVIPVFCPKLGLNLFLLQSQCLFYNLFNCILLNICGIKHNTKIVSSCLSYTFQLCCCYSSCISCFNGPIFTTV
jgi:hypothetical protein